MRHLLAIILLTGCAHKPVPPTPGPSTPESELHAAWEREVDDAVAGLTAIRPGLTSVQSAYLDLYDTQLDGLKALAGSPSVDAVSAKTTLLGNPDPAALAKLRAEKARLDARTTALESEVARADKARLAAEMEAKRRAKEAIESEAASNLSRVAALAIASGIAAFLFGTYLAIPKWVAAATVGLGVLVATTAPQLLAFFGSDSAQYIMAATFGLLALGAVAAGFIYAYQLIWPKPGEPVPFKPLGPHEAPKEDKGD